MARRISLREFQQDLVRRLTEARVSTETPTARLGVQVANEHWLVRLDEAAEVIPPPVIAPVPLTKPWFRGLTNIRGNLYSVVDFSRFQEGPDTAVTPDSRLLLVGEKFHMSSALLVGRMLGLRNLQAFERKDDGTKRAWEEAIYVDADGREWRELAMEALVYSGEFLQAGL
jgi:twitching motility protein PilI